MTTHQTRTVLYFTRLSTIVCISSIWNWNAILLFPRYKRWYFHYGCTTSTPGVEFFLCQDDEVASICSSVSTYTKRIAFVPSAHVPLQQFPFAYKKYLSCIRSWDTLRCIYYTLALYSRSSRWDRYKQKYISSLYCRQHQAQQ